MKRNRSNIICILMLAILLIAGFVYFAYTNTYKNNKTALAAYSEIPPNFEWGDIIVEVLENGKLSIDSLSGSSFAFKCGRTIIGCPEPAFPEPPFHQPFVPETISYFFPNSTLPPLVTELTYESEWSAIGALCSPICEYDDCQNTYWINKENIDIPSDLDCGTQTVALLVQGNTPTDWSETEIYTFNNPDTADPLATINYPCNTSYTNCINANTWLNSNFGVELIESDTCTETLSGNVDIKTSTNKGVSWGSWQDHLSTIDNFTYSVPDNICHFYKFKYQTTDNAGNTSLWADPGYIVKVDTQDPSVDISYPSNWITSTTFNVSLTESDLCSGIDSDSGDVDIDISSNQGLSWSGWQNHLNTIDDFSFTGSHCYFYKFKYQVSDLVGNTSVDDPGTITKIDIQLPLADISYIEGTIDYTIFNVSLTESDDCSGIDSGDVDYSINGGVWQDYSLTINDFSFTGLNGNCYTFRYQTTDNAGNESAWDQGGDICINTEDDPNVPTLIAPPITWINYNPNFKATVSDPNDDQVRAHFNILGITPDSVGNYVNSGSTSCYPSNCSSGLDLDEGTYTWRAYAEDSTALTSSWTSYRDLNIDKTAPLGTIDHSPLSPDSNDLITFTGTGSDALSGIDTIAVYVDGALKNTCSSTTCTYSSTLSQGNHTYYAIFTDNASNTYTTDTETLNVSGIGIDYKVIIDSLSNAPSASNLTEVFYYCYDSRHPVLSWTYTDPESDEQASYQVQVDNNSDFTSPEDDTGVHESSSTNYTTSGNFNWDITYYWRVKVKDDTGEESDWAYDSFQTPLHAYPNISFTWLPNVPNVEEPVRFIDQSICYDDVITGSACNDSFFWNFNYADREGTVVPLTSILQNPIASFSDTGTWQVRLEATDLDGFMCPLTDDVNISFTIPKWKEIRPW